MKDLIINQIERRARVEHGGDFAKAAAEYFRDHPEYYPEYTEEVSGVNKRAAECREGVNAEIHYRLEWVAYRDKLDLDKPADRVAAQTKVFARQDGRARQAQLPFVPVRFPFFTTLSFSANAVRIFTGSGSLTCTLPGCPSGLNGQLM